MRKFVSSLGPLRSTLRSPAPARQRGQASIIVLVLFLAAAAAISSIGTTEHTASAGRTEMLNRQISATVSELSAWYERDGMASMGASIPTETELQAHLTTRYAALRLAMSTPIVRSGCTTVMDCEPSRQILVWYPATRPPSPVSLVNGLPLYETGGDALWRLYDSKAFVQQRVASAYSQLLGLGRAISAWSVAQQRASIYTQTSLMRASNCSTPGMALPCLSGWTVITSVPEAMAAAGISAMDATSPWGSVIEITNAAPDASQTPPYTLAMRLRTPSGAYLTYTAGQ
jgi:hypothetical protein